MTFVTKVKNAIDQVKKHFPFVGYITADGEEEMYFLANILNKLNVNFDHCTLLDIGCGPANVTAFFSQLGINCYAVDDLSDEWHIKNDNRKKIMQFCQKMKINFYLQQNEDYSIPFEKGTFDIVFLNAIIEHLHESPRELLNTAFDYLKPNRYVLVTMPNSVNIRKRLHVLFGKTNYPDIRGFYHSFGRWRGHVREYTQQETEYILKEAGGNIVLSSTYNCNIHKRIKNKVIRNIYSAVCACFPGLRDGIVVVAQKPADWQRKERDQDEFLTAIKDVSPGSTY